MNFDSANASDLIGDVIRIVASVRRTRPLVHNITNFVAMDLAANALLALGASPVMAHAREEVSDFVKISDALTINSGTMDAQWFEAAYLAAQAAGRFHKPWIYDPVGVGATPYRRDNASRFLALSPTVIRANASEILHLAGLEGAGGKGVDAGEPTHNIAEGVITLAQKTGAVVLATGASDYISDGKLVITLRNGDALMPLVTAMGCALTGVIGATLAVEKNALLGATAGAGLFGVAGELAGETIRAKGTRHSSGPGSFRVAFLDALYGLSQEDMQNRLQMTVQKVL